jgi:polysaccharide deacetylase 2 family uncharacterized protein YibQ
MVAVAATGAVALSSAPTSDPTLVAAVARSEAAAPSQPPPAAAPPAPVAAPDASRLDAISSADRVEAASGVKVVRNGASVRSNALIIDVPQALGLRLPPAPDPRLVEKSRFGLLPRLGADGARPADVYARPVVQSPRAKGAARVAILVGGVGLDAAATTAAISRLPAAVSLGFAPYGADLERDAAEAREAGHEILLQAPMEPIGASANPGPHTLTTAASEADNIQSLHWSMGRFTGYVAVTNYLGGKLTADARAFSPILSEIASRGLAYLDDGSSPRSLARNIGPTLGLPTTVADVVLDASPTPEAIEAALARLEAQARRQDGAVGVATALPVSVEHIARWAAGLEARGLTLVPVSALISRAPAPTAQSDR